MKALISPLQHNSVVQIEGSEGTFDVAQPLFWVNCPDDVGVGWTYDGENFIEPVVEDPVVIIPDVVTMRQARLALLQNGLLTNVDAAINSLPSPQKEAAQIEWEFSQEVHRNKALVRMLAPVLGLSDAQLDDLFLLASTL